MRKKYFLRRSIYWFLLLILFGCSSEEADYQREFQAFIKMAIQANPKLPPFPNAPSIKPFHYDAYDKRDPFMFRKPRLIEKVERNREPLEVYPLDTLRMVGTLSKKGERRVIIRAESDGSLHTARVGSYIGKNGGRVVSVSDTEVRLIEAIVEVDGNTKERPASIVLTTQK